VLVLVREYQRVYYFNRVAGKDDYAKLAPALDVLLESFEPFAPPAARPPL